MGTNAKTPGKWPHFAGDAKNQTKQQAKQIRDDAKAAQLAMLGGRQSEAIVFLGNIRDQANHIYCLMVQAEAGIYDEAAATQDSAARVVG